MTDKKLLELAAKAAGGLVFVPDMGWIAEDKDGNRGAWWNPLGDDGDALRLSFALGMTIDFGGLNSCEVRYYIGDEQISRRSVSTKNDYRRAIVRAAAEIGAQQGRAA